MEEQQIQEFVQRIALNEGIQDELGRDPVGMIARADLSPRVAGIIFRLVPHLAFAQPLVSNEKWWHA